MRKLTPMRAIRKKCLDCCAYQPREVRLCTAVNCPLYSYRLGHKPSKDNNPINESNTEKDVATAAEKENASI